MRGVMYPTGQHPYWCDLDEANCGNPEDPNHVGRTSHVFVQSAEARISLQLSRIDDTVLAGTWAHDVKVRLTLNEGMRFSTAELSIGEIEILALLCASYVTMAKREQKLLPLHDTAEAVLANGPA